MTELQELAAGLRSWVKADGRTYEEIAKAVGISRASVYNFMNQKPTSWKVLQALLKERDGSNGGKAA